MKFDWVVIIIRKHKAKEMEAEQMSENHIINIEHLSKNFPTRRGSLEVLHDICLTIEKGEFVTIVGHSGCGKSTLLKIISGLVPYENGTVERNGHKVDGPGPNCGMVFQEHRLFPWLKIRENVGFGLDSLSKKEREKKVESHLELVGLKDFGNSYPSQLSGGMSQRAAIARGLVNNPTILLLDEPFGALDALTRIQMQKEIRSIQKKQNITMVMVTHDIDEAIVLANRVVVMSARPGEIKDIIKIDAAGRKRNSPDFTYYKKKIYDYLFEETDTESEIEYVI